MDYEVIKDSKPSWDYSGGILWNSGLLRDGYFGYLPDISFAVEGNRILLQLQADVNGV